MTYFITTIKRKSLPRLRNYENTNMFFVVKYCIKHVGLVKNVMFLINNCLGAMTTWLLSYPVTILTGIRWTTIRENGIRHIPSYYSLMETIKP